MSSAIGWLARSSAARYEWLLGVLDEGDHCAASLTLGTRNFDAKPILTPPIPTDGVSADAYYHMRPTVRAKGLAIWALTR